MSWTNPEEFKRIYHQDGTKRQFFERMPKSSTFIGIAKQDHPWDGTIDE